jgi:anti-sigma factor RsiW
MSKELNHIKEIDEYLSGELSPEHLAEFEKRIQEEENVRNDVALTKKVIEGIQGHAFKNMLKDIHSKLSSDPRT